MLTVYFDEFSILKPMLAVTEFFCHHLDHHHLSYKYTLLFSNICLLMYYIEWSFLQDIWLTTNTLKINPEKELKNKHKQNTGEFAS